MKRIFLNFNPEALELMKSCLTTLREYTDIANVCIDRVNNTLSFIVDDSSGVSLSRDDINEICYALKKDLANSIEEQKHWSERLRQYPNEKAAQLLAPYWDDRVKEIRETMFKIKDLNV